MQAHLTSRVPDRIVGLAVLTAYLILVAFAVTSMRPWGSEPARATDFESYWSGVAMASDFVSFWTGATLVREGAGASLYDMDRQAEFQRALRENRFESPRLVNRLDPYHNPPPMALLYLPLTLLPLSWAFLAWTGLSLAGFAAAVWLPLRETSIKWTSTSVMLATGAVLDALLWGQSDAVFLLALVASVLIMGSGRPFLGGVALGILWLKPQYALVFPVVFLVKRRWAELGGMILTGAALVATSVAMIGIDGALLYLEALRKAGMYYPPESSFIFSDLMVNWRALLVNLFPGLTEESGALLVTTLCIATIAGSLVAWRGDWQPSSPRFALRMLVTAAVAIVAAPHSHLHGVSLLFGPLAVVLVRSREERFPSWLTRVVFPLGFILTWIGWLLPPLRWLLAPYLLLGIVAVSRHLGTAVSPGEKSC